MEDNITKLVKSVSLLTRTSKAGNPYKVMVVEFANGYKVENFINQDQQFILQSVLARSDH